MFIDISEGREEGTENLSGETTTMGKQSKQALCVLLLKNVTEFHVPRRHLAQQWQEPLAGFLALSSQTVL